MLEGENIICIASGNYYEKSWVNCQHIMTRLSRKNKVLYIESIGLRSPRLSEMNELKRVIKRLKNFFTGLKMESNNLFIYSPIIIPLYKYKIIRKCNQLILSRSIRLLARKLQFHTPILWIFIPTAVDILSSLLWKLVIYHCVDEYSANPGVPKKTVQMLERRILKLADIVFTTSKGLYDAKKIFNKNTFYQPNVTDTEFFIKTKGERNENIERELKSIPKPIIGYVGNMSAYKVDLGLLEYCAVRNPNWSFVCVGPIGKGDTSTDVEPLQKLPNLYFLGGRKYRFVPFYIRKFDVCLIPFNINETTKNSFPIKFFEYLALGKPIVATNLPALEDYKHICRLARDKDMFIKYIEESLHEDSTLSNERIKTAKKNNWDTRIEEISQIVQQNID